MKLELYKKDTCPYCRRVMSYIEQSGRTDVEYKDIIESDENRRRLVEVGGKQQVPCLFIDGDPLYESMDIINWLEGHALEN